MLGISNMFFTIVLIGITTTLFVFQNYWQKKTDFVNNRQVQVVYNNLTVELSDNNDEDEVNNRKIIKTVQAMSILFVFCWFPFFTVISQPFEENVNYTMKKYTFLLAVLKSILNPILVFYINDNFRVLLKKVPFCGLIKRS